MNRFIRQMRSYGEQLRSVAANEARMIFGDSGVVLVVVLALLI